jgi:hypothetical protein
MKARVTDRIDSLLIFLILLTGGILRFYDFASIPFTHDEFSAVFRTGFSSFSELIRKGVMVDTHPAGVQVFLNYWIMTTGISEPWVKLPFTIMGLASVWLIYSIGKKWFSSGSALLAASFLSFLQYPVIYSQIARPYASGLFLVLSMVWFWTNLMLSPNRNFGKNLTGFILFASLCTYNHHFSLLMAGIVAFTGIFIIDRTRRLPYLISWPVLILLYLPHLPVFLSQIRMGGIGGWLSKPRPDFLFDYLAYAGQFSLFVALAALIILILGFFWGRARQVSHPKFIAVAGLWFLLPMLVGYAYSVLVNPVLQFSVLLFSFPFFLLFLFSLSGTPAAWQKALLTIIAAAAVIPSLVFERMHYRMFYHSPYREIVEQSMNTAGLLGRDNCFIYLDSYRKITDYYLAKPGIKGFKPDLIRDFAGPPVIDSILDRCQSPYFIYGCNSNSPPSDYPKILKKFPFISSHLRFNEGDFLVFSKIPPVNLPVAEYYMNSEFMPGGNWNEWLNYSPASIVPDETDSLVKVCNMNGIQFSPTFKASLRDVCRNRNDIIDFLADVGADTLSGAAWLQIGIYSHDSLMQYISEPITKTLPGTYSRFFCSCRLADIDWRHHALSVQAFIWNPSGTPLRVRKLSVAIRQGNPFLYSLVRKIER